MPPSGSVICMLISRAGLLIDEQYVIGHQNFVLYFVCDVFCYISIFCYILNFKFCPSKFLLLDILPSNVMNIRYLAIRVFFKLGSGERGFLAGFFIKATF